MATSVETLLRNCDRAIAFDDARERILATAVPVRSETAPIENAHGRTLAQPIIAQRDNPAGAVSAMDGYAIAFDDLDKGSFWVEGETAAGEAQGGTLTPGSARRIFTGALLPPGADTILIQEEVEVEDDQLRPLTAPHRNAYVRPQGFDFKGGHILLNAGTILSASALLLSASANIADMEVAVKPKVALLSTGNELRAPGQAKNPQDVIASNGLALTAVLQEAGADVCNSGVVSDDLEAICSAIEGARDQDLLITTGGASVGDFDLVQAALAKLGGQPLFWQVMMRPGKPVFLWELGSLTVLGLPGNPVSAYVCARLLAVPWVRASLGQTEVFEPKQAYVLGASLPPNGPRHQFARATLVDSKLIPAKSQDSSLLRTLFSASVLIDRAPNDPAKTEGEQVMGIAI